MPSPEFGETDQPHPLGTEFLQDELAALQETSGEAMTPGNEITMAIIRWCLGQEPTLGRQWTEVHQNPDMGRYGYDTTTLTMQNDAARLIALGLAEAGDIEQAWNLMDQVQPTASYEPGSKIGYTHYIRATIAANSGDLEAEVRERRTANDMWNRAALRGEKVSEGDLVHKLINTAALTECEELLDPDSPLKETSDVDPGDFL